MGSPTTQPVDGADRTALGSGERAFLALALGVLLYGHRLGFEAATGTQAATPSLDHALHDPTMVDPTLALLATAFLMFRRRARIARILARARGSSAGWLLLLLGGALLVWSRQIDGRHLVLPAALLSLFGAAFALGGRPLGRAVAWPLAPLALAIPLPPQVMNALVFPMQLVTVELASLLLDGIGRAHEVRGDLLITRGVTFQVIEGCSGFKSTVSLMLAAIVYGELVLERPVARLGLIAFAIPIGIAANGLRVLGLILGRIEAETDEHVMLGLAAMVVGVLALALFELLLSKGWARLGVGVSAARAVYSEDLPAERVDSLAHTRRRRALVAVGACWFGATALAEALPIARWPAPQGVINIETLPSEIQGRTSHALPVDTAFLGTVAFGHWIHRAYSRPVEVDSGDRGRESDDVVRVFVGHEDVSQIDRTGHSPKTMIPRSGWLAFSRPSQDSTPAVTEEGWERWVVDYPDRRVLVLQWRPGYAPWGFEAARHWLGLDRIGPARHDRSALVVRLERDLRGQDTYPDWLILRQFAREIESWVAQSGA